MIAFLVSILATITGFFHPHPQLGGVTLATSTIASAEDAYFQANGKYIQILPGSRLAPYDTGSLSAKIGANIPADIRVDVYESDKGKGYQITYTDDTGYHSIANGPEASSRTVFVPKPVLIATTTP